MDLKEIVKIYGWNDYYDIPIDGELIDYAKLEV